MDEILREKPARVFFALWPEEAERAMCADTLHLTLAFFGDVAPHRLEALQLAAQEVSVPPFELDLELARYSDLDRCSRQKANDPFYCYLES